MYQNTITLPNGTQAPMLALGTWLIPDDIAAEAVKQAINIGYRHIDTAQAYGNERGVGEGVRASGIDRGEIFVTSKVMAEYKSYDIAAESINESLKTSGLDYFDLMLIHCPQPWDEFGGENRYFAENRQVWRALEEAYNDGKVKAIGVSNFNEADIENILSSAEIKPMVNQIPCFIGRTQTELIDYCKAQGIVLEAYSPIAHGDALNDGRIAQYASKYGVTVPQFCIKYDLQLGMITLPKTTKPCRMRENADLDFVISDEDMAVLMKMQ